MISPRIPRSGLLSREQAKAILEPHAPRLLRCFYEADEMVQSELDQEATGERRAVYDPSTVAAMIYCWFVRKVESEYANDPSAELTKQGRMLRIRLHRRLVLRFKKFDDKLCSRNVRTNTQAAYYWQMELEGVDPITNVTFGYRRDAAGRVDGVFFTCPTGWSQNKWMIAFGDDADSMPLLTGTFGGNGDSSGASAQGDNGSGPQIEPKRRKAANDQ